MDDHNYWGCGDHLADAYADLKIIQDERMNKSGVNYYRLESAINTVNTVGTQQADPALVNKLKAEFAVASAHVRDDMDLSKESRAHLCSRISDMQKSQGWEITGPVKEKSTTDLFRSMGSKLLGRARDKSKGLEL